jgi:hypothetical protein
VGQGHYDIRSLPLLIPQKPLASSDSKTNKPLLSQSTSDPFRPAIWFIKMTFQSELQSWLSPAAIEISPQPEPGSQAPSSPELPTHGAVILVFLRHCGCPFAEKTFTSMRSTAESHPEITFIAVSHSDRPSTDNWLQAVGGQGKVQVIVDDRRELYAKFGLGTSSFWHVLNPWSMGNVFSLARAGTKNRPTESGNRWQTSGTYVIKDGKIVGGGPAKAADDTPNLEKLVHVLTQ